MDDPNVHIDSDPAAAPAPASSPAIEGPGAPGPSVPAAPDEPGLAAPPSPGAQPRAPASAQPSVPGQPPAAPAGAAPTGAPEPWSFRADRQTFFVEGSSVDADGSLRIPKSQLPLVQQLLAEGAAHRGSWREQKAEYEARIAELEQSVEQHPDLLRARAFNAKLNALMEQGPDAVAAWLDKFEQNREVLKHQAENAVLKHQLEDGTRKQTAADQDREAQALVPVMQESLQGVIGELATQFPGVDGGKLYTRLMRSFADRVFYEVPVAERRRGLAAGEVQIGQSRDGQTLYVMDRGLVEEEFQHWASLTGAGAGAATAAVQQNRAALAGAPPVAVGSGGPAQGGPTPPLPKTKEELDKWIQSGEYKKNFPSPALP